MSSDATDDTPAALFDGLRDRLAHAVELALEMRESLMRGDAEAIDTSTARLGTIVTETRLLVDELRRIQADDLRRVQVDWDRAHEDLLRAATRLARESAVAGRLLDGLVALSQRLLETFAAANGDSYDAAGHAQRPNLRAVQLKETI